MRHQRLRKRLTDFRGLHFELRRTQVAAADPACGTLAGWLRITGFMLDQAIAAATWTAEFFDTGRGGSHVGLDSQSSQPICLHQRSKRRAVIT